MSSHLTLETSTHDLAKNSKPIGVNWTFSKVAQPARQFEEL